ncbi:hypothetical protein PT974_10589 [Cladobotryum mycophilum]|uniref:Uncharacterized protein n=1 Tax=Cladobotryum mycophilum TaxID=491253 RepID=A0ABR0SBQ7_9HYPO
MKSILYPTYLPRSTLLQTRLRNPGLPMSDGRRLFELLSTRIRSSDGSVNQQLKNGKPGEQDAEQQRFAAPLNDDQVGFMTSEL